MNPPARILLIDDDAAFTGVLARQLSRRGHAVDVADCAAAALAMDTAAPDWILLDLKLGEDNGLQLLAPLRARHPAARIVLATGYASIPTAVDAIRRGAWHYLAKPFTLDSLLRAFSDSPEEAPVAEPIDRPPALRRLAWEHIQRVLAECGGNVSAAADALGIHRRTLQRRLAKRPVRER